MQGQTQKLALTVSYCSQNPMEGMGELLRAEMDQDGLLKYAMTAGCNHSSRSRLARRKPIIVYQQVNDT